MPVLHGGRPAHDKDITAGICPSAIAVKIPWRIDIRTIERVVVRHKKLATNAFQSQYAQKANPSIDTAREQICCMELIFKVNNY